MTKHNKQSQYHTSSWYMNQSTTTRYYQVNWTQETFYTPDNESGNRNDSEQEYLMKVNKRTYAGTASELALCIEQYGKPIEIKLQSNENPLDMISRYELILTASYLMLIHPTEEDRLIGEFNKVIETRDYGVAYIIKLK